MRAAVRGTEIYFDIDGPGLVADGNVMRERPTAFVIHGGPGVDHSGFKPGYSPLTDRLQLVYFDHRGHGRSGRGDRSTYTLDENVEDLEALRRHLGLGPIVSIGGSYGGMVAQAHAARYPESVSHLILIVTAAHGGFHNRAAQIVAERGTEQMQEQARRLWAGELTTVEAMQEYFEVMGPLYSLTHDPEVAQRSAGRTIYAPEPITQAFAPGGFLRTFDLRPELAKITAPTLIIAGRHDWICPPEFSEEIHRLIPHSDLRIFENSGHSVRADETDALFDAIRGFVVYNSRANALRARHEVE